MSNSDVFSMAFRNLFKRKMRTFLTILSVIIGSASIIMMISFGLGINESYNNTINRMGDITTITIPNPASQMYFYEGDGLSPQSNKVLPLDENNIKKIKNIEGVSAVSPSLQISLIAVCGKYRSDYFPIMGIDRETMQAFGFEIQDGRLLESTDKMTAIFGSQVVFNFYNSRSRSSNYYMYDPNAEPLFDVMKEKIMISYDYNYGMTKSLESDGPQTKSIKPINLKVAGILEKSDDKDYFVYMDINEVKKLRQEQIKFEQSNSNQKTKAPKIEYDSLLVKCTDINTVETVKSEIESLGFRAQTLFDYAEDMKQMSSSIQLFLGFIGGISLFVAAIGIANTMIMSIYERTREIGIMKVIGASINDIKKLFLLEASLIGFFGGLFGVGLSLLVSIFINKVGISFLANMSSGDGTSISIIPLWLIVLSLVFSAAIGLISGYFPARRAMNLSAISAIRIE